MIRICGSCMKELGEKEPLDDTRVSHSICQDCCDETMKGIELGESQSSKPSTLAPLSGRAGED